MAAKADKSSRSLMAMTKRKKKRGGDQKIRVGLEKPNYERDFEFPADAPGRVIVRLERLMGTDMIRITDLKYLATLLQRLEEEEDILWKKRTWERRKAEHNRFRQLVIDGYTEPGPGMEDLINNPLFRVNRVLNRLGKLDMKVGSVLHLPPMNPVEPFEDDDTGEIFKSYPGHILFAQELELKSQSYLSSTISGRSRHVKIREETATEKKSQGSESRNVEEAEETDEEAPPNREHEKGRMSTLNMITLEKIKTGVASKKGSFRRVSMKPAMNEESEVELPEAPTNSKSISLHDIQRKYGVAPNVDLGVQWKPYQSDLVNMLFTDKNRGVLDLYELGDEIVGVYDREQLTADEYIASLAPPPPPPVEKKVKQSEQSDPEYEEEMWFDEDEDEDEDDFWRNLTSGTDDDRSIANDYEDDGYEAEG